MWWRLWKKGWIGNPKYKIKKGTNTKHTCSPSSPRGWGIISIREHHTYQRVMCERMNPLVAASRHLPTGDPHVPTRCLKTAICPWSLRSLFCYGTGKGPTRHLHRSRILDSSPMLNPNTSPGLCDTTCIIISVVTHYRVWVQSSRQCFWRSLSSHLSSSSLTYQNHHIDVDYHGTPRGR